MAVGFVLVALTGVARGQNAPMQTVQELLSEGYELKPPDVGIWLQKEEHAYICVVRDTGGDTRYIGSHIAGTYCSKIN